MDEERKTPSSTPEKKIETKSIGPKPEEIKPDQKSDPKTDEDILELKSPEKAEVSWL